MSEKPTIKEAKPVAPSDGEKRAVADIKDITEVKIIYKKDEDYAIVYPTDATGSLTKVGDIELDFHSDLSPIPKIGKFLPTTQGIFGTSPTEVLYETDEKKESGKVILDRHMHEKIVFSPSFAIDTAVLLIDLALSSPNINLDKETIKTKLNEFVSKL